MSPSYCVGCDEAEHEGKRSQIPEDDVVVLVARRDIEAGEEFTFDYRRACAAPAAQPGGGEAAGGAARVCRCGALECAGRF